MIAGIKDIEFEISHILNAFRIEDNVEIRYSNIENTDIQCNNLVRHLNHPNIRDIKKKIEASLLNHPFIKTLEIAENGFINLNFSNEYLKTYSKNHTARITSPKKESILFDYGGPNIGKDLHVGHIRTLNIGRSLYNIFKLAGHDVVSDIHLGDWGMPIGLILAFIEKEKIDINSLTYIDLETIYPKASELSASDKDFYKEAQEISKKLNSKNKKYLLKWKIIYNLAIPNIKNLLKNLNYEFDWWRGESDVVDEVKTVVNDPIEKNLDKMRAMMNQQNQDEKLDQNEELAKLRANTSIEKTILSKTLPNAKDMGTGSVIIARDNDKKNLKDFIKVTKILKKFVVVPSIIHDLSKQSVLVLENFGPTKYAEIISKKNRK